MVDNASADGTPEMVSQRFPEVKLTALDWNAGFSRANNLALAQSSAPYVLLLNPDTEAVEPFLDALVELMESRPEVGICGCRLVRRDGSFDHAAKRSFPTPLSALAHFSGAGRRGGAPAALAQYRAPEVDERGSGEVDAVNGAFMLVRRSAIEDVGPLDEGYWLYMEDLDWCRRFKDHGWKVWYEGSVTRRPRQGRDLPPRRPPRLAPQPRLPPLDGALLPQARRTRAQPGVQRSGLRRDRRQARPLRRPRCRQRKVMSPSSTNGGHTCTSDTGAEGVAGA